MFYNLLLIKHWFQIEAHISVLSLGMKNTDDISIE